MLIDIRGGNIRATDAMFEFIRERFEQALGRRARRIRAVQVHVEDVNGPRGGVDKLCRAEILLAPRGEVIVDATEPDLYEAIQHAAKRARTSVFREVDRRKARRRAA